jgi:hypothetical protein
MPQVVLRAHVYYNEFQYIIMCLDELASHAFYSHGITVTQVIQSSVNIAALHFEESFQ